MWGAWYIISPLSEKVEGTCPPCLPPNCTHDCNVIQTPQCDVMYAFLSVSGIIALATRCAIKKLEGMQHSNAETNTAQNALATRTTKLYLILHESQHKTMVTHVDRVYSVPGRYWGP